LSFEVFKPLCFHELCCVISLRGSYVFPVSVSRRLYRGVGNGNGFFALALSKA
jgi:hypothetical protein